MQGHLDLAIDTLSQTTEIDPANFNAQIRMAQLYHMRGDSKHAADLLNFVTKANPGNPAGWETTARVAIDAKEWLKAQAAINVLDGIEGQHMTATFLKAEILALNGKADEAIATYKQVIDTDPASPLAEHALPTLIGLYRSQNHLDIAAQYIEGLKADTPFITTALGECDSELGKTDQAATSFDKAIAAHPAFQAPYLNRAELYIKNKQPDQAIEILRQAAAAVPGDFRAPMMAADVLNDTGNHTQAIAIYNELLKRNPELGAAANNLAETIADYQYDDTAALDRARQTAERFIGSGNPLLLDTLAWVYYRQNNIEQAETVMKQAVSIDAKLKLPAQMHYHYGAILAKSGHPAEAKAELQQATADNATYPGKDEAQKLLTEL
jgi:tetratricopeptide (TPR) repeat protein